MDKEYHHKDHCDHMREHAFICPHHQRHMERSRVRGALSAPREALAAALYVSWRELAERVEAAPPPVENRDVARRTVSRVGKCRDCERFSTVGLARDDARSSAQGATLSSGARVSSLCLADAPGAIAGPVLRLPRSSDRTSRPN